MIDPDSVWVDEFKKLKPASTSIEGVTNLASTIKKLTDKVDPNMPGAQVAPGIFQFNQALFIAQFISQAPTQGQDWASKIASAWSAACTGGIVTPGKVTASSTWTVSSVDSSTVPTAAATIPTVSAGQAAIMGALAVVPTLMASNPTGAQEAFAKAFRKGVVAFTFVLIGISGTPISPVTLPVTVPAK